MAKKTIDGSLNDDDLGDFGSSNIDNTQDDSDFEDINFKDNSSTKEAPDVKPRKGKYVPSGVDVHLNFGGSPLMEAEHAYFKGLSRGNSVFNIDKSGGINFESNSNERAVNTTDIHDIVFNNSITGLLKAVDTTKSHGKKGGDDFRSAFGTKHEAEAVKRLAAEKPDSEFLTGVTFKAQIWDDNTVDELEKGGSPNEKSRFFLVIGKPDVISITKPTGKADVGNENIINIIDQKMSAKDKLDRSKNVISTGAGKRAHIINGKYTPESKYITQTAIYSSLAELNKDAIFTEGSEVQQARNQKYSKVGGSFINHNDISTEEYKGDYLSKNNKNQLVSGGSAEYGNEILQRLSEIALPKIGARTGTIGNIENRSNSRDLGRYLRGK